MEKEVLKGKKILIVEDDLSSRLYLNKLLEKTGAVLINAGDGKEALILAAGDKDIAVILMDIQLPVMDGFTSAKLIREQRKDVIIIAQTAYGLSADMESILSSGFDDYIIKPIFQDQIIQKIISLLR
jgi:CheY-like chemotaxis protein